MRTRGPFGLVVLDLVMPNMDGAELIDVMRRDPALANIPSIMSTSGLLKRGPGEFVRIADEIRSRPHDDGIGEVMSDLLEDERARVLQARHASEAVPQLRAHHIDFAINDLVMPVMTR